MSVLVLTNMYPSEEKPIYGIFVREQVEDLLGLAVKVLAFAGHSTWFNYARAALELRRELRSARFDLIHAHYGLSGAVALAQLRVPVVTTFHGSDAHIWWQRIISSSPRAAAYRSRPRWEISGAACSG
jgi:Glycosyltransferase Family 4